MKLTTLHVCLLGGCAFRLGNSSLHKVKAHNLKLILAFLIKNQGKAISRQKMASIFWPESGESQSRTNLRKLLHHLRGEWPWIKDYLEIDLQNFTWKGPAVVYDADEFESRVQNINTNKKSQLPLEESVYLEETLKLYQGDYLPDCLEEWVEEERTRLKTLALSVLEKLCESQVRLGHYHKGLDYAWRWQTGDPFSEGACRALMRLHALNKDRSGAMKVYHDFAENLKEELGIKPEKKTSEIYFRLTEDASVEREAVNTEHSLVGRLSERAYSMGYLEETLNKAAGVLIYTGEAGIGKTCLAESVLASCRSQGYPVLTASCYAAGGRMSYGPVRQWLGSPQIQKQLGEIDCIYKSEISRLLPEIKLNNPDLADPGPLTESWQRQTFFAALCRAFLTEGKPLIFFVDDIQWCDSDTLEWLHYLMHFEGKTRLLVLGA